MLSFATEIVMWTGQVACSNISIVSTTVCDVSTALPDTAVSKESGRTERVPVIDAIIDAIKGVLRAPRQSPCRLSRPLVTEESQNEKIRDTWSLKPSHAIIIYL